MGMFKQQITYKIDLCIQCTFNITSRHKSFIPAIGAISTTHTRPAIALIDFNDLQFFALIHWYAALAGRCKKNLSTLISRCMYIYKEYVEV